MSHEYLDPVISTGAVGAFALASLVIIAVPGPSVLFVVGRALALGRRDAMASVVGNALGVYVVAVLVALGLGTIVQESATAFLVARVLGGGYLIYLGVQAIRHRGDLAAALTGTQFAQTSAWRAAREGFLVGVANPKAFIMFGAVLPAFVDRGAGGVPQQMLVLALVAFAIGLISDSLWALAAAAVRDWFATDPRRLAAIGGFGGLAMIGVGVSVLATGRR